MTDTSTRRPDTCTICGVQTSLHYDSRNRFQGCKGAALATIPVDRGQLFVLVLTRNRVARQDALATLRELPNRRWQVRIGGRVRGRTLLFRTKRDAYAAVETHYTEAMHRQALALGRR